MTDQIEIIRKAIMHYDRAVRLRRINEDLYDHLSGSIVWILGYCGKNQILLPNREMCKMVARAESLFQDIINCPLPEVPKTKLNDLGCGIIPCSYFEQFIKAISYVYKQT